MISFSAFFQLCPVNTIFPAMLFAALSSNYRTMLKKILKKMMIYIFIALATYLLVGNLMHRIIFPERRPDVSSFFKPGDEFYCKTEGFKQTVTKQENGFVYGTLEAEPYADGPPKHIHDGFDEIFEIENGELTIWINGEIKKLHPGEKLFIGRGTPHKPYNETADTIRLKGNFSFPEKFAVQLTQVYGFMDANPDFANSPKMIIQMPLFQSAGFDSYLADGPPVFVQKIMDYIISPAARLFGYRSYYEKYNTVNRKK